MYATQGASTSRLPTDSGITLYKGLDAAPHEANFADFPDPPPIAASMIGQQLATVPDLIRQAQVMTHVHWGSPSQHTSSITPTMPISDLNKVRAELQTIIWRLAPTLAAPGMQSHTAVIANSTLQLTV